MLQKDRSNPYFNNEGYPDPTPYAVIKKEQDLDKRVNMLIKVLKSIIHLSGFVLLNRIVVQDEGTGKIFK